MRRINTKVGTIFSWYDFIKPKKNKATNTMTYNQSNTKLENYSQRYIGLHLSHNDEIYIAVAVNKKGDQGNWWKFIIENRIGKAIKNGGTINEMDKGITMVPLAYKDLLFKDPYAFTNLYGMIDPTYLDMALKEATRSNNQLVESYANSSNRT